MVRTTKKFPLQGKILAGLLLLSGAGCAALPSPGSPDETRTGDFSRDLGLGHLDRARGDLFRALRQHPRNVVAWNNLACLDFRQNDYSRAQGDLDQALALDPGNPFLLLNKARLLLARKQYSEARTLLGSLESVHPWQRGFRLLLAIADVHTGHPESARILLNEIINDHPSDPLATATLSRLEKVLHNG
ncbi:MAG: tetratricopeptide repeat protein [Leptospirales bacterium]